MPEDTSNQKIKATALMENQKKLIELAQTDLLITYQSSSMPEPMSRNLLNLIEGLKILEEVRKAGH